jgi:hypothetical protein
MMIPILSSLFHHYNNLPQLEHGLHQLSRRYTVLLPKNASDYWEYTSLSSDNTGLNGNGDGATFTTTGNSQASFLQSRAAKIESLKSRLESELHTHIHGCNHDESFKISCTSGSSGGLVHLLSCFYRASDARLRGKIRKWMGRRLYSHSLGDSYGGGASYLKGVGDGVSSWGLGASFAAYCPNASGLYSSSSSDGIVGGAGPISLTSLDGMIQQHSNPLGVENTSACGIEGLLQVLLLIIAGFQCGVSSQQENDTNRKSRVLKPIV